MDLFMQHQWKTVILEDDFFLKTLLELLCKEYPHIEYCGAFEDVDEAIAYIASHTVDLVFLDIHLRSSTGWDLLPHLSPQTRVVVTSSNQEDELPAERLQSVSALLPKPVQREDFYRLLDGWRDAQ